MTATYRLWAEECGKIFGGTDILTVDGIHLEDGREFIIEMNDSASGFLPKNQVEDMGHVRDLIVHKWTAILSEKRS